MADPKNVIVEIKNGLADVRQQMNLLKQDTAGWVSSLSSGVTRLSGVGGGGGGGGVTGTLVAPNPKFTPPTAQGGGNAMVPYQPMGGNIVANTPPIGGGGSGGGGGGGASGGGGGGYTGNTNLSQYVTENPTAGVLYAAALTSGLVDKPGESVEAQLLMSRTGYFTGQGYDKTNALQATLAKQGTVNNKMDVMRGLSAAQGAGITGPNVVAANGSMSSVASGVASASNLVPGMGFEGTMRAYASMQQGRNVNMLRGIGIQLRDDQGNLKPPDQIIDDIWKKICRDYAAAYGSGKKPSKQEVQIGLQPGNSMDSMLDLYFGNDPMAKQLVANGLLYKAETGGGAISKSKLTELGATTEATNAFSARNAAGAKQTGKTAKAGAEGYTMAANQLAAISNSLTDNFLPALEKATKLNAYFLTMLGAANDVGEKGLAGLAAKGGIVGAAATAILAGAGLGVGVGVLTDFNGLGGDKGPYGGGAASVTGDKGTPDEFAKGLLDKLGAKPTQANIDAIKIWAKKESGGVWGAKGGAYNPLNTTLESDGSTIFNSAGVRNYQSMEQGINATYGTLTGNESESRGYDRIVNLMRSGASREQIVAAISASDWPGKGGYKDGLAGIRPNISVPNSTTNNNNTNVTINVNGAKDPYAIGVEIERIMNQQAIKNKAVNK